MADEQCFRCGKSHAADQMKPSPAGNRFCAACWTKVDTQQETLRQCPADRSAMKKRLVGDAVVIDVCPKCGGLWFDKGELEIIEKKSREMGWQQGFFTSIMVL